MGLRGGSSGGTESSTGRLVEAFNSLTIRVLRNSCENIITGGSEHETRGFMLGLQPIGTLMGFQVGPSVPRPVSA